MRALLVIFFLSGLSNSVIAGGVKEIHVERRDKEVVRENTI